jgi:hypothetical protein
MMTDNMRKFVEAVEADADLRAKIEALQGSDDAVEQIIAIAADHAGLSARTTALIVFP